MFNDNTGTSYRVLTRNNCRKDRSSKQLSIRSCNRFCGHICFHPGLVRVKDLLYRRSFLQELCKDSAERIWPFRGQLESLFPIILNERQRSVDCHITGLTRSLPGCPKRDHNRIGNCNWSLPDCFAFDSRVGTEFNDLLSLELHCAEWIILLALQ